MTFPILNEKNIHEFFFISSQELSSPVLRFLLLLGFLFPAMLVTFLFLLAGCVQAKETKKKIFLRKENVLQLVEVD